MITSFSDLLNIFDCSPWPSTTGRCQGGVEPRVTTLVYTPEQRQRRNSSPWTMVQGILAPLQFLAFLVSTCLVLRYLASGHGYQAATISVVVKTGFLYAIMITGSIWEDVFSFLVIGLHTAYLFCLVTHVLTAQQMMLLALTAFAAYVVNAAQFLMKLRAVRREAPSMGAVVAK
jgi:3-vinyl bacteriochlorophyllide hydratase